MAVARKKPTPEEAAAKRQANLEKLSRMLENAVAKLTTSEDWANAIAFAARFRSRSFNNTLLIWAQHLDAYANGRVPEPFPSYVAGFQDWKKLDRSVMKGQLGYMIYQPNKARFASANPSNPGSWRRLGRNEQPNPGEVVRRRMMGVIPGYVWDVSQTEGAPVPERPTPRLLEGQAPAGLREGLIAQITTAGFAVSMAADAASLGGANGVTNYTDRTVQVRADMDDAAQVKTIAHELAHVRMHEPGSDGRPEHRGVGEVEAESVALMIGAAYGMDTRQYTVPYVASWSAVVPDADPLKVIRETGERVRRTAADILDKLPAPEAGDGNPPGLTHETPERAETREPPAERAEPTQTVRALARTTVDVLPLAGGVSR